MLIKEKTNIIEEQDIFSTFTIDKPSQEPGNIEPRFIYVGTNMGRIIKILINNRQSQNTTKSIREIFDSQEDSVNCIDIFENFMITGHHNGNILFWENNKIFCKTQNTYQNHKNIEVIFLKIIKINPRKKFEIIYSGKLGKVFFLKRVKGIFNNFSETKELLVNDYGFPIYKISFYSPENDLKKTKKKLILFALNSPKGITFIKIRPKIEQKDGIENGYILKYISSPTGKTDNGIFNSSFGFGFPPMQEKSRSNNVRGSISGSIIIGKNDFENLYYIFNKFIYSYNFR